MAKAGAELAPLAQPGRWAGAPGDLAAPALLLDADARVLDANLRALDLFGAAMPELLGGPMDRWLAPRDGAALGEALRGPRPAGTSLELDGRRADGSALPLEGTLLPAGPAPACWLLLLRDIASRRQAEQELHFEKALLESQNEASIDGILIVDAASKVVSMNGRFLEMWGVPEDLLQRGGSDEQALRSVLEKLEHPDEFIAKIEWLFDHPDAETRDEVRFKDGRVFERWSTPVHGRDGTYYGRGWYFRDITDRKRQQLELQRAMEQLREHDRFRTQLINNISHDLATPLTPIKIQLHLLRRALGADAVGDHDRALAMLDRNLEQLSRLVADLKDVAQLQAGRLRVERAPLELNRLVQDALQSFQGAAADRGVALVAELGPPADVVADAHRITQVLFNLITNALKFTPAGGRVAVRTTRGAGEALVAVEDTGRGLAPEELARLFKPFSQVHEAHEVTERGTGLGLFICKGLVEQHEGRIWAASAGRGRGATFTFALPQRPCTRAETSRD
ncbi:MAG TPA: PAS domain-containing sensor histidine kinase [Candidatus Thermoplasmatota archaeon]|jgi:signal transduction histidine kinase|nr:PAS domain-containing sensor histidine kinase [Candidatus Thermoplasmatota archaeon]